MAEKSYTCARLEFFALNQGYHAYMQAGYASSAAEVAESRNKGLQSDREASGYHSLLHHEDVETSGQSLAASLQQKGSLGSHPSNMLRSNCAWSNFASNLNPAGHFQQRCKWF